MPSRRCAACAVIGEEVYQDVEVEIDIPVADADIPAILVTNVFRAVQESLNNVARHAAAESRTGLDANRGRRIRGQGMRRRFGIRTERRDFRIPPQHAACAACGSGPSRPVAASK